MQWQQDYLRSQADRLKACHLAQQGGQVRIQASTILFELVVCNYGKGPDTQRTAS